MVTPPAPCNHEEADTRMILHAANAAQYGHHNILIITVDTDVFVLAIAFMQKLKEDGVRGCWVGFGAGTHLRYIPVHIICDKLGRFLSFYRPQISCFVFALNEIMFATAHSNRIAKFTMSIQGIIYAFY